jgi:ankyrin repeat protein
MRVLRNKKRNRNKLLVKIRLSSMRNLSPQLRKIKLIKSRNVSRKKLISTTKVISSIMLENTKKKWNALIWACCSGYTPIVKLLLSRGAGQQYL